MEKRKYPRKTFIKLGTSEGGDCEILNLSSHGPAPEEVRGQVGNPHFR
jgi:hypothetical protein